MGLTRPRPKPRGDLGPRKQVEEGKTRKNDMKSLLLDRIVGDFWGVRAVAKTNRTERITGQGSLGGKKWLGGGRGRLRREMTSYETEEKKGNLGGGVEPHPRNRLKKESNQAKI